MTAEPRSFTVAVEGSGPAELDYRGPQGWATVVHRAYEGQPFCLRGPDGGLLGYEVGPREHDMGRPRVWEYRVGLSGPQRLRIESAEQWSISVTPLEQDEVEDGGYFSYRGIGCQLVEIVRTDSEPAAIVEFTKVVRPAGYTSQRLHVFLAGRPGVERWEPCDTDRVRFLHRWNSLDAARGGRSDGGVATHVEVREADNHEWRLRVLPLSAAEPLETVVTGSGTEVIAYEGHPGALTLRQTGRPGLVQVTGFDVSLLSYADRPLTGGVIVGNATAPTLLQVKGDGGWELRVTPLDEVRAFDRQIGGTRGTSGEVVRYTGPPATAVVGPRPWSPSFRVFGVRIFTADLIPEEREWAFTDAGPLARFRPPKLDLRPGMLAAVQSYSAPGWQIRAKPKKPSPWARWTARRRGKR
ncbi:hypothetical protein OH768_07375 [Streptomyces sp. NBC_01622]|uniref:hypothetical protein n=1 Tax=Streptomyces sp. NBC_01622 TaxID=2975903 RepID=UPI00386385E1|nr:hypothetical protein OH768_07375 [Streptomyces sp. NBC_01622]